MQAMVLEKQGKLQAHSLTMHDVAIPEPGKEELLLQVTVCGVCRTDLHLIEGDLPPVPLPIIPGHQVVGVVEKRGSDCQRFSIGDRVGVAWLRYTCGECSFCQAGKENLCPSSRYTGYHANGGYAEYTTVPEDFAYAIPEVFSDEQAAPLLCAGIIGYHAYKKSQPPRGGNIGMIGFGSSAHITLQIALHHGCRVFVASRNPKHQQLAKEIGATWVGTAEQPFPEPLDSVIVFAPAGPLVPVALQSLKKGGTVSLAGIAMTDIPAMNYRDCLFHEKQLVSTEANTRKDGKELLRIAAEIPITPHIVTYPLEEANEALIALKEDRIQGTAVLHIS